jgi:MYXO-CTERM domain-containing protein
MTSLNHVPRRLGAGSILLAGACLSLAPAEGDTFFVSFGPVSTGKDPAATFPQTVTLPQWDPTIPAHIGYDLVEAQLTFTATFWSDISIQNENGVPMSFSYTLPLTSVFSFPFGGLPGDTATLTLTAPNIAGVTPLLAPLGQAGDTFTLNDATATQGPVVATLNAAGALVPYIGGGNISIVLDGFLDPLAAIPESAKLLADDQWIEASVSIRYSYIPEGGTGMAALALLGLLGAWRWRTKRSVRVGP